MFEFRVPDTLNMPSLATRNLTAILGALAFQGGWNAATNTPTIPAASAANHGWYYIVTVAGTTDIDGTATWAIRDFIVSTGTVWVKIVSPADIVEDTTIAALGGIGDVINTSGKYRHKFAADEFDRVWRALGAAAASKWRPQDDQSGASDITPA